MNDHLDSISQSLNRLHREGEAGIYKVSEEKKYYIQASGEKGGDTLYVEAVSNNFLAPKFQLDQNKESQLRSLGWIPPEKSEGNFYRELVVKSDQDRKEVADFLFKTLKQVYDLSMNTDLNIELVLE